MSLHDNAVKDKYNLIIISVYDEKENELIEKKEQIINI